MRPAQIQKRSGQYRYQRADNPQEHEKVGGQKEQCREFHHAHLLLDESAAILNLERQNCIYGEERGDIQVQ